MGIKITIGLLIALFLLYLYLGYCFFANIEDPFKFLR